MELYGLLCERLKIFNNGSDHYLITIMYNITLLIHIIIFKEVRDLAHAKLQLKLISNNNNKQQIVTVKKVLFTTSRNKHTNYLHFKIL